MRGTPPGIGICANSTGIIPAYAGNTGSMACTVGIKVDHPRVCGEHHMPFPQQSGPAGSSPRMRGTRSKRIRIGGPPGIIPAYAGNTRRRSARRRSTRDHPRVCGEHPTLPVAREPMAGSSPRMRGTLHVTGGDAWLLGIIPAYAGNTTSTGAPLPLTRDHPRVCGEHCGVCGAYFSCLGSSPRMRGTPGVDGQWRVAPGIIPAYAGNTPTFPWSTTAARDHPRVCGEHVQNALGRFNVAGSSPRMRGTHARNRSGRRNPRIIPAYAGNTCSRRQLRPCRRDHPRVCGEHPSLKPYSASFAGSSPRMRGTPCPRGFSSFSLGIIPAYAGNTSRRWWR